MIAPSSFRPRPPALRALAGFLALFILGGPVSARAQAEPDPSRSSPDLYTVEDKSFRSGLNQTLSLHKLNYAILGADDLKLQYSFKYRVIDEEGLFLAFTNAMVWQIYDQSIPVKDNNFMPEAFYRVKEGDEWFVALDAGYLHMSNGQAHDQSRSLDCVFVRAHKSGIAGRVPWYASAQFYGIISEGAFTSGYDRYLGWWDVTLWVRNILRQKRSGLDLQLQRASGRGGHPFQRGNNVVGLQYRLVRWDRFNPILYVQWFEGYGEVLLDFDRYNSAVRGGLSWFY